MPVESDWAESLLGSMGPGWGGRAEGKGFLTTASGPGERKNEALWTDGDRGLQVNLTPSNGGLRGWSPFSSPKCSPGGRPGQNPVINGPLSLEQRGSVPTEHSPPLAKLLPAELASGGL